MKKIDVGRTLLNTAATQLKRDIATAGKGKKDVLPHAGASFPGWSKMSAAEQAALQTVITKTLAAVDGEGGNASVKETTKMVDLLATRAKEAAGKRHITDANDVEPELRDLVLFADTLDAPSAVKTDPTKLASPWAKAIDGNNELPRAWKIAMPKLPDETDFMRRLEQLRESEHSARPVAYRQGDTLGLWSATEGEGDARLYLYDAKGKEMAYVEVHDEGDAHAFDPEPIPTRSTAATPAASYAEQPATIAAIKRGLDATRTDEDFFETHRLDVPKSSVSKVLTPDSWLLPESFRKLFHHFAREGGPDRAFKHEIDGKRVYCMFEAGRWKASGDTNVSDQKIYVFDPAGNQIGYGTRVVGAGEGGRYNWDVQKPWNWA